MNPPRKSGMSTLPAGTAVRSARSDVGFSLFDGTSREPSLVPTLSGSEFVLAPHYEQIRQYGLDAQLTTESLLLKLEAIHRTGAKNNRLDQNLRYEERGFHRICRWRRIHILFHMGFQL